MFTGWGGVYHNVEVGVGLLGPLQGYFLLQSRWFFLCSPFCCYLAMWEIMSSFKVVHILDSDLNRARLALNSDQQCTVVTFLPRGGTVKEVSTLQVSHQWRVAGV